MRPPQVSPRDRRRGAQRAGVDAYAHGGVEGGDRPAGSWLRRARVWAAARAIGGALVLSRPRQAWFGWLAFVGLVAFGLYGLVQQMLPPAHMRGGPVPPIGPFEFVADDLHRFGPDKLLHLIGFALIGLLAIFAAHHLTRLRRWRAAVYALLGAGAGFSLLTEAVQGPLPYRSFDAYDLAANAIGVAIGVSLPFLLRLLSAPLRSRASR